MLTLFLRVCLADSITILALEVLRAGPLTGLSLIAVIVLGAIMLMNVTVGVLFEAISEVAEYERLHMQIAVVDAELKNLISVERQLDLVSVDWSEVNVSRSDLL